MQNPLQWIELFVCRLEALCEGAGLYCPFYISAYPNAGLPNQLGEYDETPEKMALQIKEYLDEGLISLRLLRTTPCTVTLWSWPSGSPA